MTGYQPSLFNLLTWVRYYDFFSDFLAFLLKGGEESRVGWGGGGDKKLLKHINWSVHSLQESLFNT